MRQIAFEPSLHFDRNGLPRAAADLDRIGERDRRASTGEARAVSTWRIVAIAACAHAHFFVQGSPVPVRYARSVGLLRADTDGLGALAGLCEVLACTLTSIVTPSGPSLSGQATSAAVNSVHTDVGATLAALAGRMDMTAAKLTAAAAAYTDQDASSASDLAAAAESARVVKV